MAYSFEHVNRRKATHINADTRNLLECPERERPVHNYADGGDGKSQVWQGHSYYNPTDRSWQKHHEVKALPRENVPHRIEFQSEKQWVDYMKKRDTPGSGPKQASSGWRNAPVTPLQLQGYAWNPFNLYRTGTPAITMYNAHVPWPTADTARRFPTWRGPKSYYGYYHEELDVHHAGGYRYPRDPRVLVNDEDIIKYEYMHNTPELHSKSAVELPVLT